MPAAVALFVDFEEGAAAQAELHAVLDGADPPTSAGDTGDQRESHSGRFAQNLQENRRGGDLANRLDVADVVLGGRTGLGGPIDQHCRGNPLPRRLSMDDPSCNLAVEHRWTLAPVSVRKRTDSDRRDVASACDFSPAFK